MAEQLLFYRSQHMEPLAFLPREGADVFPEMQATKGHSVKLSPYLIKKKREREREQNWSKGNDFQHRSLDLFLGAVYPGLCQNSI